VLAHVDESDELELSLLFSFGLISFTFLSGSFFFSLWSESSLEDLTADLGFGLTDSLLRSGDFTGLGLLLSLVTGTTTGFSGGESDTELGIGILTGSTAVGKGGGAVGYGGGTFGRGGGSA